MTETRELKRIETQYFQKSQFFMYPLLKIPPSLTPINTYISWQKIKPQDAKLICLFDKSENAELQQLEKLHILSNAYLSDMHIVKLGLLYVFDLSAVKTNWDVFLDGEYSYLSKYIKGEILKYYSYDVEKQTYAHCYLHPNQYYNQYAELLQVDPLLFYEDTELVQPPDLEKEFCRLK
jgi:hypothetical protein